MKLLIGLIFLVWAIALIAGHVMGLTPDVVHLDAVLDSPSMQYWFGTDDLGRDIFSRVLSGIEVSLRVALVVTAITMLVGVMLGMLAGFYGGMIDAFIMRVTDVFLAFPGILLAIAFAAVLGPGINNLILALSLTGWVNYARLMRGQTLSLCNRQHVVAARALGAGDFRLMVKHILPLTTAILTVEGAYQLASVMIAEASLSFLGLGIQAPQASWGAMLRDAVRYMLVAPHYVLIVGLCLMSVILAINLGGDDLRDKLDVRKEVA